MIWPLTVLALGGMLLFLHERFQHYKAAKTIDYDKRIDDLNAKFDVLNLDYTRLVAAHADVFRQSEEVKRIVNNHNLKQMFGPKV